MKHFIILDHEFAFSSPTPKNGAAFTSKALLKHLEEDELLKGGTRLKKSLETNRVSVFFTDREFHANGSSQYDLIAVRENKAGTNYSSEEKCFIVHCSNREGEVASIESVQLNELSDISQTKRLYIDEEVNPKTVQAQAPQAATPDTTSKPNNASAAAAEEENKADDSSHNPTA